jgi:alpha-galactosidase
VSPVAHDPEKMRRQPVLGQLTTYKKFQEDRLRAKTLPLQLAFVCSFMLCLASFAQDNVAATPPMGWNSWNHFAERVDDATIRATANALVSTGLRDAGYVYLNIDDTWEGKRDASGVIHPNEKFPDMKALADYVHSKGLKLGIYSSPGPKTCAGFEGSLGHEEQDAQTYAQWGIDYLKYDWCQQPPSRVDEMKAAYTKMHDALKRTGRPIVLSLCQYGWNKVWEWGPSVGGNLWRTTGDISDRYGVMAEIGFNQNGLEKFAGPGHWNDPDMLEVGNGGMNEDEYRTHFSLWAMLAAPLIAGNDLTRMTPYTVEILTNREVIAVDQDSLGKQGYRVAQEGPFEIWMKPMADGSKVVGLFNRQRTAEQMTVSFGQIGIRGDAAVRDLWLKNDAGMFKDSYSAYVPPHGVVLVRIKQK